MFWKEIRKFWINGLQKFRLPRKLGFLAAFCLAGLWGCRGETGPEFGLLWGNRGYVTADGENLGNLAGAAQVEEFCRKMEAGEAAGMTLAVLSKDTVSGREAFTKYECRTRGKKAEVKECYFTREGQAKGGGFKEQSRVEYEAGFWEYTDGYLFFGPASMSGYDGPSGCTALRVEPLEKECLEWSRRYLRPTGYGKNNLFLEDWDEEDYGKIDFSNLFDAWYPLVYQRPFPYPADENCNVGAVYRIPAEEFEAVIQSHLSIDRETLREKAGYFPENPTYEYRPRGLYDCHQTDLFPEVTAGRENKDGTITLTVRAVDPGEHKAAAFTHETVVRPLDNGGFQYVSNRVLSREEPADPSWYKARLTEEEWEEIYGEP